MKMPVIKPHDKPSFMRTHFANGVGGGRYTMSTGSDFPVDGDHCVVIGLGRDSDSNFVLYMNEVLRLQKTFSERIVNFRTRGFLRKHMSQKDTDTEVGILVNQIQDAIQRNLVNAARVFGYNTRYKMEVVGNPLVDDELQLRIIPKNLSMHRLLDRYEQLYALAEIAK